MLKELWSLLAGRGDHVSVAGLLARSGIILGVGLLVGVGASLVRGTPPEVRQLMAGGHAEDAEQQAWDALGKDTATLEDVHTFLRVHVVDSLGFRQRPMLQLNDVEPAPAPRAEADIDARLQDARFTPEQRVLAAAMHAQAHDRLSAEQLVEVRKLADQVPPHAFSNRVLAWHAEGHGELSEAAERFEAEARAVPAHLSDLDEAVGLWERLAAWDVLQQKVDDPLFAEHISPMRRVRLALRRGDVMQVLRRFPEAAAPPFTGASLTLVLLAGWAWLLFFARLGRFAEDRRRRWPLALLALGLGVLSVGPTLLGLLVMEDLWGIRADGTPLKDLIYFVVSVGLREEGAKALCAALLLPALWRINSRVDALVMGSLVGLGFAVEENLGYLMAGGPTDALGRFLTANPLHCFTTGLVTLALYDLKHRRSRGVEHASNTFMGVVALHGIYDFLLASPMAQELSYFSMVGLLLLVRAYLSEVNQMRRGTPLLPAFVNAVSAVAAGGFVYGAWLFGPWVGLLSLAYGLLSSALLIYAFVRELDRF